MATDANETIRMCIDWPLSEKLDDIAKQLALKENEHNAGKPDPDSHKRLAGDIRKFWKPGTELHIRFLDDNAALRAKVIQYAQEWLQYANLKFIFDVSPQAQIRISFTPGMGSMSRVGLDANQCEPSAWTMNLDPTWFVHDPGDVVVKRTVLHEFGHALGFIHEHQSPMANIVWNERKVMQEYSGPPNNWSPEIIRFNILDRANPAWTNASKFDEHSIMLYPVEPQLTINNYRVDWNNKLSEMDKQFAAKIYPR